MGGYGRHIEAPDEVASAIEECIERTQSGTPTLLEVVTSEETQLSRPRVAE
jgi:acetolactate synthase-1/2/3 large subunit